MSMLRALVRPLGCLAVAAAFYAQAAVATGHNFEVTVEGMTCKSCVNAVKAALSQLPDVEPGSVKVSLKKKKAEIALKQGKSLPRAEIEHAIQKAGYEVTAVTQVE